MSCVCVYMGTRCIGGYMFTCVFVYIGEQDVLGGYMFTCVFVCKREQDVLGNICLHVCLCVYGNKMYWGIYVYMCVCVYMETRCIGEYMFTCVFVCIWEQDVLGGYMFTCVFVCKREQGGSCSSSMFPTQWTIITFPLGYKRRKCPFWDPLPKLKVNHECHS